MSSRLMLGLVAALVLAQPVLAQPARLDGKAVFAKLDTNADGLVTKNEVTAGRLAIFDRLDINADGRIDQGELTAFKDLIAELAAVAEGLSAQQFRRLDSNRDQIVSREEVMVPGRGFDWADRNRDGALDNQEFDAIVGFLHARS